MKLAFITHEFAPFRGGAATYVQEIAAAAAAQDYPVEVWTATYCGGGSSSGVRPAHEPKFMFHVEHLPSNGRLTPAGLAGLMRGLLGFRRLMKGGEGTRVVLLSVGAQMAWMLLYAPGWLPARGVTCFFHGSELLRFARQAPWRWLAKRFFARVDGFAVASRYVEDLARRSGLLPAGAEICVAPCACPSVLAAGAGRAIAEAPASGASLRVLTVARLHPRKGQVELARALVLLPADLRQRVIYQMVGTGTEEYRAQIEAVCRAGGVRREFLGNVPDERLGPVYAGCTLYAQASRTLTRSVEGFGISFLEASLHGKPVAAYVSGGIGEAVVDGQTGLLVPEGKPEELAAVIEKLLLDPALRERLGEQGQRYAVSFDWVRSARLLCEFALRE